MYSRLQLTVFNIFTNKKSIKNVSIVLWSEAFF
jgi:hypothetical protein